MIPIRYNHPGSKTEWMRFRGVAGKILKNLEIDIKARKANYGVSPIVRFADGTKIQCKISYGETFVDIIIPSGVLGESDEKKECLCNCGFTVGQIIEVRTETIDDAPLYDVIACNGREEKSEYVFYENILASDFTEYLEGDVVVLIPYNEALYSCCTANELPMGCNPIVSEFTTIEDDWRSTYRIIPWDGSLLPKWRYFDD